MKQLTSAQIRQMWLDFWKSKGHAVEPSANLVPVNDPTLLWINSGVATLKKYFDGSVIPENPRITNSQKAIRTNDIENVGKTARHHTMFEMLGNFSVGDYFRDEAIEWGYELLTSPEWFDFPKDKLYMTYYPDDKDSYNRWIACGVEPSHLIPIEDNFWEIGAGPSSGKSVLDLQDQILKSSLTVAKTLTLTILVFVCLKKILKTIVTLKFGTSFCHNSTQIQLFHVQNIKNFLIKTLIRAQVLNVL